MAAWRVVRKVEHLVDPLDATWVDQMASLMVSLWVEMMDALLVVLKVLD